MIKKEETRQRRAPRGGITIESIPSSRTFLRAASASFWVANGPTCTRDSMVAGTPAMISFAFTSSARSELENTPACKINPVASRDSVERGGVTAAGCAPAAAEGLGKRLPVSGGALTIGAPEVPSGTAAMTGAGGDTTGSRGAAGETGAEGELVAVGPGGDGVAAGNGLPAEGIGFAAATGTGGVCAGTVGSAATSGFGGGAASAGVSLGTSDGDGVMGSSSGGGSGWRPELIDGPIFGCTGGDARLASSS